MQISRTETMRPETLQIIDKIVARGDGGKEVPHFGGPFLPRLIRFCSFGHVKTTGVSFLTASKSTQRGSQRRQIEAILVIRCQKGRACAAEPRLTWRYVSA